jgi:hypothetical protein
MAPGLATKRSEIRADSSQVDVRSRESLVRREDEIGEKNSGFKTGRVRAYPIGVLVRVRLISGREIEGQVIKVETTALGTFMHVEFDDEVANVTGKQVIGFYDFCFLKAWMVRRF